MSNKIEHLILAKVGIGVDGAAAKAAAAAEERIDPITGEVDF